MFPNAINTTFDLLNIVSVLDSIGNKHFVIKTSKNVVGITKSITSMEFQTSVVLNIKIDFKVSINAMVYDNSKYALIQNEIYKIERTYVNGQFIELYLSLTDINKEELTNE